MRLRWILRQGGNKYLSGLVKPFLTEKTRGLINRRDGIIDYLLLEHKFKKYRIRRQ